MKSYTSKELLKILNDDGWQIKNQVGSHIQLVHSIKPGKVTVPHPRKSLPPKLILSIFKQAELK
jgi:predicted RNA binding protein YcfA (HicA-like mRNA interferase family)